MQIEILKKSRYIDFYSDFRKNDQGGQIEMQKKCGIDFHSGFRKNYQGGGGANRNPIKMQVYTFIVASGKQENSQGGGGVQFEILKKYAPLIMHYFSSSKSVITVIQRYALKNVRVIPTNNYGYLAPEQ